MITLIVTTTAVIVFCGLTWHDQPAREHQKVERYGSNPKPTHEIT
jgi:hypothetical protein